MVWSEGAIFHPDWYRKYIFPKYKQLWEPIKASGKKLLFCSDGDFTEFIDDFIEAGVDAVIPEPMTDFEMICERYGDRIAIFGWDMFLTAVGIDPDGFDRVLQSILELNMQIYTAQAKTTAPCFL